jgi:hypothetical protein
MLIETHNTIKLVSKKYNQRINKNFIEKNNNTYGNLFYLIRLYVFIQKFQVKDTDLMFIQSSSNVNPKFIQYQSSIYPEFIHCSSRQTMDKH